LLIDVREESAKVKFKNITTNHRQQEIMLLMKKLIKKVKPSYTEEIEEKEEITEDNKIEIIINLNMKNIKINKSILF